MAFETAVTGFWGQDFGTFHAGVVQRVERLLEDALPAETLLPARLHQAMRYATLLGGKRVRPLLVYATGYCFDAEPLLLDRPACAVELVHAYSLVHDDLPAMDDDDLRRGQPTCHKQYDEATAILVGDALQARAFQVLADSPHGPSAVDRLKMIQILARAAGSRGMVGGQALDLAAVGQGLSLPELESVHIHKTGMLISVSAEMALLATGLHEGEVYRQVLRYAHKLGLAFQVWDDVLDEEGDPALMGKHNGADRALNKPNYVALLGLREAKTRARSLVEEALTALDDFGPRAEHLRKIARFAIERHQ